MKIKITFLGLILTLMFLGCKKPKNNKPSTLVFVNDTIEKVSRDFLFATSYMPNCYSSSKLSQLIPKKEIFIPIKISEKQFNSLNAYEHFIHSFYYPEWYYQSCLMFDYPNDLLQKIPANLKRQGEGLVMSNRQKIAITQHRDSSIILIKKCIQQVGNVNDEFKRNIINLKAYELIPTLIATINNQKNIKDPYILTTLCQLMRFTYEPFINSSINRKLYPKNSKDYKNSIPFTKENHELIISFASDYFEFVKSKNTEFIRVKEGTYKIGEKGHSTNPLRDITIKPFHISRYEVTNKQFKQFIENTGYITLAEKNKNAFVFRIGLDEFEWKQDTTANWRCPNGFSQSGITDKMNHPVTCISYIDALAYCTWAKVRLPTIEEWEIASRGYEFTRRHYFGNSTNAIYEHGNIWRGKTHLMEYEAEDYITTSPVGSFKPNPLGLYDIYGNVFEFCSNTPESFNIYENIAATRGGSWWCSMNSCGFFNSIDIGRVKKEASFSNNGFRVVL